jgi:putative FmdB family regulatory protein
MPTYEYECKKCGYKFEEFQRITEPPIRLCPRCKGKVRRLIGTGAGFIFKGSGFHQTDYRSPSYIEKAKKEAEAATGGSTEKPKDAQKHDAGKDPRKSKKDQDS